MEVLENKQSDVAIANKLEIRGGWHHRKEDVDYRSVAYRQEKYREFIKRSRTKMETWNDCFELL